MNPILRETAQRWEGFSGQQKMACAAAFVCTAARPAITAVVAYNRVRDPSPWRPVETAALAVAALTDMVDGALAKKNDAVTPAGEAADPFADKVMMNTLEATLVARGEMSLAELAIRGGRDAGISLYRNYVTGSSDGKVSIKAGPEGRINTFARLAVDIGTASGLNIRFPRTFRGLRAASTASTVICGALSIARMRNGLQEWRAQQ